MTQKLSLRTTVIYYLVVTITLIVSFLSVCFSSFIHAYGLLFASLLILFIGVPHGATDHLVFNFLSKNNISVRATIRFYLLYIFSALAYALCWLLFPSLSLNIFIIISVYHLGQSNFHYLTLPNKIIKAFIYSCWGLFIISAPLIFKAQEAKAISQSFNWQLWLINIENKQQFLLILVILNILVINGLFSCKYITQKELLREHLNLLVLGLLFYTNPLIISFGIYFSLWHSLGSTFDQIQLFKRGDRNINLISFYLKAMPLTIASLTIFLAVSLILVNFNIQELAKNLNTIIALFFIFLATITLPHTIIRDRLYRNCI